MSDGLADRLAVWELVPCGLVAAAVCAAERVADGLLAPTLGVAEKLPSVPGPAQTPSVHAAEDCSTKAPPRHAVPGATFCRGNSAPLAHCWYEAVHADGVWPMAVRVASVAASAVPIAHIVVCPPPIGPHGTGLALIDGVARKGVAAMDADAGVGVSDGVCEGVPLEVADAGVLVALHEGHGTTAVRYGAAAVASHCQSIMPADQILEIAANHVLSWCASTHPLEPSDPSTILPITMRETGMPYDAISSNDVPGKEEQSTTEAEKRPVCVV